MLRIFNALRTLLHGIENKAVAAAQDARKCVHEFTLTGTGAAGRGREGRNAGICFVFTPPYSTSDNTRQIYFMSNSIRNEFRRGD
jgi:hypothetical protein